ncbi:alpha/beta hydrolase family protein [Streptomyces sp. NPDC057682]|uniref:alpha/beta hydrolase family protein n=1 Tax=Streptomyces sp. NPDC057682 TaxID=3346210 RepID=UPI0036A54681
MTAALRMSGLLCAAATLLVTASLAGCSGGGGDGKDDGGGGTAAEQPDDFTCLTEAEAKSSSITFTVDDGSEIGGYAPKGGSGAGIVLAHQADGTVCQWKDKADELSKAGYRVLAVNSNGQEVDEVVGAAGYLRDKGAKKILLMGASKGGTAVLAAAPRLKPQPDAVVALSAPTQYQAMNALKAVPELTAPVLYMAADGDGDFAVGEKELNRQSVKSSEHRFVLVRGESLHGVALLDDAKRWGTVRAFLTKYGS